MKESLLRNTSHLLLTRGQRRQRARYARKHGVNSLKIHRRLHLYGLLDPLGDRLNLRCLDHNIDAACKVTSLLVLKQIHVELKGRTGSEDLGVTDPVVKLQQRSGALGLSPPRSK